MESNYKVSVFMRTHNSEKYLSQALDSVFKQITTFKYEVVIGDDASTDSTPQIIQNYYAKYPEIVNPIFRSKNLGMCLNAIETLKQCKGKYIAWLDSDDYWTDETKLEMQFQYMESNPTISVCYTNAYDLLEREATVSEFIKVKPLKQQFDLDFFINQSTIVMPAVTLFIRKSAFPNPFPSWLKSTFNDDWALIMLFLKNGNAGYIDSITSVYRRHVSSMLGSTPTDVLLKDGIRLAKNLDNHFNYKYHSFFNIQWRFQELAVYFLQKKRYLKGFYYLIFSFCRKPIVVLKDVQYLKKVYKVLFTGWIVYD